MGLGVLLAVAAGAARSRDGFAELMNPYLGPEHSQWLVGAISELASREEIEAYLGLREDGAAERFIEEFWRRRDPDPAEPGNPMRETFEARVREADRRFSEAGVLGRRTDRGSLFIVYGPPKEIRFELSPIEGRPPIELWIYGKAAPRGLDGKEPGRFYRFHKLEDLTVRYVGPVRSRPRIPPRRPPP